MPGARAAAGTVAYLLAFISCGLGAGYVVVLHLPFWLEGQFFLSAFSGTVVLLSVGIGFIFFSLGHMIDRRHRLDVTLTLLMFGLLLMLWALPSRFSMS